MSASIAYTSRSQSAVSAFRLSAERQNDIAEVACGYEEGLVGIRTRYYVDLAGDAGVRDLEGGYLFDAERFLDQHRAAFRRLRRCWRALRAILQGAGGETHVGSLFAVYGPHDPWALRVLPSAWGELRFLARFTDAVEARRARIVREAVHARLPEVPSLHAVRRLTVDIDRRTSSREALRSVFELPRPNRRDVEREILAQGERMLSDASRVYHETWART